MKGEIPAVTVLMSVCNGEEWLEATIKSVLNQSLSNFEFIIIDDGSIDRSRDIISSFSMKDDRIKTIYKENTGLAESLNLGIKSAKARWIARIDSDDLCEEERLKKQYKFALDNPQYVLIGSNSYHINELGEIISTQSYPSKNRSLVNNLSKMKRFFPHSSALIKKSTAIKVGLYRPEFEKAQDHDLWLRMSMQGELFCLQERLVKIREHPNSISRKDNINSNDIYTIIAILSFLSCKYLNRDLNIFSCENSIKEVLAWIKSNKHFNYQHKLFLFRQDSRQEFNLSTNQGDKLKYLVKSIPDGYLFSLIYQRVFGNDLPLKLFKDMNKEKFCVPINLKNKKAPTK